MPGKDGKGPRKRSPRNCGRGLGKCKKNKGYTNKRKVNKV